MTLAQFSLDAFALINAARIFAYIFQVAKIYRDTSGARAVSILTWLFFAAANLATVSYALINARDVLMAAIFSLNLIGCMAIVGLTTIKRVTSSTFSKP